MITFCQSTFLLKEGQTLSKNVENKLKEFSRQELNLFYYVFNMNRVISHRCLCQKINQDANKSLKSCALEAYDFLANKEFDKFAKYEVEKKTIYDAYDYIAFLKNSDNTEYIERIKYAMDFVKKNTKTTQGYSFSAAVNILKKRKVALDEGTRALKSMLFARDFYDIDSIFALRKRLFKISWYDSLVKGYIADNAPHKDLISVFFADYRILEQAILMGLRFEIREYEYDDDFTEAFDYFCILVYFRFIIDMYLVVGQCDTTGFFDDTRLEIEISKTYHIVNILIYNAIYRYLSPNEHLVFVTSSIMDDICLHMQTWFDVDRLTRSASISGALARDSGHADFGDVIDRICSQAERQWEQGSTLNHMEMIDSFRRLKKYAEFFSKRGFERKLNEGIKQLCRKRGFKVILGEDIASRQGCKKKA